MFLAETSPPDPLRRDVVPLALAQSETYRKLWHDPEVTDRIDAGIEANRKGWVTLQFAGQNGKPLSNVKVTVEQTGQIGRASCRERV